MKSPVAAILVLGLIIGCTAPAPSPSTVVWTDRVPSPAADEEAHRPVVARGPDSITLLPISPRGAVVGAVYAYDTPHCGINDAIDVDGDFWDAKDIDPDSVDFDGARGTFQLTTAASAIFTRSDGAQLHLMRHAGAKEFRMCM